jgi:hypothetical protein
MILCHDRVAAELDARAVDASVDDYALQAVLADGRKISARVGRNNRRALRRMLIVI